jgi:hypothetical protein
VLVLVAPPRPAVEVAAPAARCAVEQLPIDVEHVGAAVIGRVRVVDDAVLQREPAEAVQLEAAKVDPGVLGRAEVEPGAIAPALLGEDREVEVEVGAVGRDPGKVQPIRRL